MNRKHLVAGLMSLTLGGGAVAEDPGQLRVGVTKRALSPAGAHEWRGSSNHHLAVTIWYPAAADAVERPLLAPPGAPRWRAGSAAPDAALASRQTRFPLVVLSHGTGGSAFQMGWLGTALARHGYVAAAVDHPGNSAADRYTVEGYARHIPGARLEVLPGAGHYTFLDLPTELTEREQPLIARDAPGVDRASVHARVAAMAAKFFDEKLR